MSLHHGLPKGPTMKLRKNTMKKFAFAFAAISAFGAVAAYAEDAVVADADGNGTYSLEELVVTYPTLTQEVFVTVDANADGAVSAEELAAAVAAGTVK
jgi:hypothetical protein